MRTLHETSFSPEPKRIKLNIETELMESNFSLKKESPKHSKNESVTKIITKSIYFILKFITKTY